MKWPHLLSRVCVRALGGTTILVLFIDDLAQLEGLGVTNACRTPWSLNGDVFMHDFCGVTLTKFPAKLRMTTRMTTLPIEGYKRVYQTSTFPLKGSSDVVTFGNPGFFSSCRSHLLKGSTPEVRTTPCR